jgi:hypothetical protein
MFNGFIYNPVGDHTTDSTISASTDLTPPTGANVLRLQAATQSVRYRLDGQAPTASTGFLLAAGVEVDIPVAPGKIVKVIETTASASIQYQWLAINFAAGNVPPRR